MPVCQFASLPAQGTQSLSLPIKLAAVSHFHTPNPALSRLRRRDRIQEPLGLEALLPALALPAIVGSSLMQGMPGEQQQQHQEEAVQVRSAVHF